MELLDLAYAAAALACLAVFAWVMLRDISDVVRK